MMDTLAQTEPANSVRGTNDPFFTCDTGVPEQSSYATGIVSRDA